jgi:hypothetical protein
MRYRLRALNSRYRFFLASTLALSLGMSLTHCGNTTLGGDEVDMGPGTDQQKTLLFLTVSPDNDVVQVDVNQTAQRTFAVIAHYSDSTTADVSGAATLALENSAIGTLAGTTFTTATSATAKVGFSRVVATYTENGQTQTGFANLTVVWLRLTGVATDFFFQLPYMAASQDQPLSFGTNVQSLDSFFAVDTTGSMGPEIQQLKTSLTNVIIPGVKAAAAKDAQFGVAAVEDFPVNPYGTPNSFPGNSDDQPLILLQGMTADVTAAQNAVAKLLNGTAPRGNGNDLPEGQMEALYQLATGIGNIVAGVVNIPSNKTGIGGAGFRKGALPVITMITDAIFHTKGEPATSCSIRLSSGGVQTVVADYAGTTAAAAHTRTETHTALNNICGKVVGVSALRTTISGTVSDPAGICNGTADLVAAAKATGAVVLPVAWDSGGRPAGCAAGQCCTGLLGVGEVPDANGECPLVFKVAQDGSGLDKQVVSGITQVARFSKFTVTTQTTGNPTGDLGEPLPTGKTTADFITAITPKDATPPPAPPTLPAPVIAGNSFTKVYPGSTVRFTVTAVNTLVQPGTTPQVFRAKIKVLAGGCADLDEREVIILVPPKAPVVA